MRLGNTSWVFIGLLACTASEDKRALSALDTGSNSEPFPASDTDDRVDDGAPPDTWVPPLPSWTFTWVDAGEWDVVDECASTCLQTQIYNEGLPVSGLNVVFEQEGFGFLGEAESDQDGRATVCVDRLGVGLGRIAASLRADAELLNLMRPIEVRPFGYTFGLTKPMVSMTTVPWTPVVARHTANPVLSGGAIGAWNANGPMMPSVVHGETGALMVFAGQNNDIFSIGVATSDDGETWSEYAGNPVFEAAGETVLWRRYSVNSPAVLQVDGTYWLWVSGRAELTSGISIGLATSEDGFNFVPVAENPVFEASPENADWEGQAVAHPTVTHRDGVYEMWYSTGLHRIGYAISTDGKEWSRYCGGPVLRGDGADWENNAVKAAEVIFHDDLYWMTFTGGETGAFRVGWAASHDGIRWVTDSAPLLTGGMSGEWDDLSVLAATWQVKDDEIQMWYTGTSAGGTGIGIVTAPWEAP
jgi:predicted GH43/DUF377 family glycosyl hydrolase